MRALVFRYSLPRLAITTLGARASRRAFTARWSPLRLEDVPLPLLPREDWAVVRTSLAGICGSDAKQVFLRGARDNPLTALISFPHILGHEALGVVESVGPGVRHVAPGQRVVLTPWLACGPRGFTSPCDACNAGDYQFCSRFTEGMRPGIHLGNCAGAGGAFAERFAAHESQLVPVPDAITDEQAVLADPVSVQLHAVLRHPPPAGEPAVVYGCGTLGLATVALLRVLHPDVTVWAVARHRHQAQRAQEYGAQEVLPSHPDAMVERVAALCGVTPLRPWSRRPWLMRGAGIVYDTVGSPETVETSMRIASPRAEIVVSGVEAPRRFEWTPLYFKEISVVGSNAFAVEDFEGQRMHAFGVYFELVRRGLDLAPLVTHRFPLARYADAFAALDDHGRSLAIKAVFDFR